MSIVLIGIFFGFSLTKADDVMCTALYDPVCGVNGVTYGNDCVATQQSKVAIAYKGACVSSTIILDAAKKEQINSVFTTVTSIRNKLDIPTQKKYYTLLGIAIDFKVKEWGDFAKVAKFTADGYVQFQRKIAIYSYLSFLVQQKLAGL